MQLSGVVLVSVTSVTSEELDAGLQAWGRAPLLLSSL